MILGVIVEGRLLLEEVHRFISPPVKMGGSLRWNLLGVFEELKIGLRKSVAPDRDIVSVSVDSWGVDYVLMNAAQPMLGLPHHYRDPRTEKPFASARATVGDEKIFAETGIQFLAINTLYQLLADQVRNLELLALAERFLTVADYFHFLFCGVGKIEESMASTTQLYNPTSRDWSWPLIAAFDLPARIFPEIVPSGTRLGPLLPQIREETGLPSIDVIATCSHDTGAAVAAIPAEGEHWAFVSSGTWSLIGVELPSPLINADVRAQNFTNEAGFGGTTRFLKNIAGMWLLQESQRTWQRQGLTFEHGALEALAIAAGPARAFVNPNAVCFAQPDDMPDKIAEFCRQTAQPAPATPGEFVRCVLESLALLYRELLKQIERLTGRSILELHIVGGGSRSRLLNQMAADATGRTVLAGPVEATAAGNILIQAISMGELQSLGHAREIVRRSFKIERFEPEKRADLAEAAERFARISSIG